MMRANFDLVVRPFECVFEQIAGHLVEILRLACNGQIARHILRKGDSLVRINFAERAANIIDMDRDQCLRARRPAQGCGPTPARDDGGYAAPSIRPANEVHP